ncbi:MAG: hypothetical protein ACO23H_15710, partial [Alphaproteobacteria bacterium]
MTVYLDYNAAAPLSSGARAAMTAAMEHQANPSSVHKYGRYAHQVIEGTRASLANAVGARY